MAATRAKGVIVQCCSCFLPSPLQLNSSLIFWKGGLSGGDLNNLTVPTSTSEVIRPLAVALELGALGNMDASFYSVKLHSVLFLVERLLTDLATRSF